MYGSPHLTRWGEMDVGSWSMGTGVVAIAVVALATWVAVRRARLYVDQVEGNAFRIGELAGRGSLDL